MQDQRCSTFDAARRAGADGFCGLRRADSPRGLIVCSAFLLFVVWPSPALVVILLCGVCWIGAQLLDPRAAIAAKAKRLGVDVASLDWKWLFIDRDQAIAAVNELVAPVGTPVNFRLTWKFHAGEVGDALA